MIIVWRGWGIVVVPIAFVAFALAVAVVEQAHIGPGAISGLVFVAASGLGALGIWLIAHRIESEPGRVFIEKQTGREIVVRRSAGSLFFIPTRYWSFIVVGIGVVAAIQPLLPH
jgi:hypothetical protein